MHRAVIVLCFVAVVINAQSMSVGNGKYTYQIDFSDWTNPAGKTWTGAKCDVTTSSCDTSFRASIEVFGVDDTHPTDLTWPGPKPDEKKWMQIGDKQYSKSTLKDFAYLNLTGADFDGFKSANLRVEVLDLDVVSNDEIGAYFVHLPGLRSLSPPKYEEDSQFSKPIELEPVSNTFPDYRKGQKANRDIIQQMRLAVKVRAWGGDGTPRRRSSKKAGKGKHGDSD